MSKPFKGDWIVYYSSKDKLEGGSSLQKFTALGQVMDTEPYQPPANGHFKPYRRHVKYLQAEEAEIRPLLKHLTFIKNKRHWGFYLISGFREISKSDFAMIRSAMK